MDARLMVARFACAAALAAALPSSVPAQADTSASLVGYAKSAYNGQPLAGVLISVPAARRFVTTDSSGTFELSSLPVGRQKVRISYRGRDTEEHEIDLRHKIQKRVAVLLDVGSIDLAPVVVEVQHPDGWRDLAGFYERRRWYAGAGNFYTRQDLDSLKAQSLSSVLHREGIFTRCINSGCVPTKWVRGSMCPVRVSVDGIPFWEHEFDDIPIADVQGIEVYRGGTMVLWGPQMARTGATRGRTMCAWVAIWTR